MNIIKKIQKNGLLGSLEIFLKRVQLIIYYFRKYLELRQSNFKVVFINEGDIQISMPSVAPWDIGNFYPEIVKRVDFASRTTKESLLRWIVHQLITTGYFRGSAIIVDIGSWIGDNALVWGAILKNHGQVIAIDPSRDNLSFVAKTADLNRLNNVVCLNAVCSAATGVKMYYSSGLSHVQFKSNSAGLEKSLESISLDDLLDREDLKLISLLHIDVEGMEYDVLKGSLKYIKRFKPVVIFEQHIVSEDISRVAGILIAEGYKIWIINEVLPGCNLDCRNFIAFHSTRVPSDPRLFDVYERLVPTVWQALPGPMLIELQTK